jgi:polar amino acid transport system substrate-binding protein
MKTTIALLAFLNCLAMDQALAGETLVLNSGSRAPLTSPQHNGALDVLYQTLAERLGITIQIQHLPAERALLNANAGIDDGDVCRVRGITNKYPDLIQVPEVITSIKWVVFSKSFNIKITGVNSLRPYRVGILIGRKLLEEKITGAKSLIKFSTDEEIIDALERNQIDLGIIEKSQGMALIQERLYIKMLRPALFQDDCYLYLNKKHRLWVPVFAAELKKMKQDGSLTKIFNDGFRPYLNGEAY